MILRRVGTVVFLFCALSFSQGSWAIDQLKIVSQSMMSDCTLFEPKGVLSVAQIKERKKFVITFYNVENLFEYKGGFERTGPHSFSERPRAEKPPEQKAPFKTRAIMQLISKADDADIAVTPEVENEKALQDAADLYAEGSTYAARLIDGNDGRGIDVGFLINRRLPFFFEHITYKDTTYLDPETKQVVKLFSRDFTFLVFRMKPGASPFLILGGIHNKSQRDMPGDPRSVKTATAQFEGEAEIVKDLEARFPGVPIIIGGDGNRDFSQGPKTAPEAKSMMSILTDAFDLMNPSVPTIERTTHTFHPRPMEGETPQMHPSQMDIAWLNDAAKRFFLSVQAVPYMNNDGTVRQLPQTFQERAAQPSDHRRLKLVISTDIIPDEPTK